MKWNIQKTLIATALASCCVVGVAQAQVIHPRPELPACAVGPWTPETCPVLGGYNLKLAATTTVALPAKATPGWGKSAAEIPARFAYNILLNFEGNANLNAVVTGMDNVMLARLSTELKVHDKSNYTPSILAYAAEKLNAVNLHRLEAAFGPALMTSAIAYAPTAVRSAYNASKALPAYPLSEYWWVSGLGAGVTDVPGDLYLYDLFLESYTAGAGGPIAPAMKDVSRYYSHVIKEAPVLIAVALVAGVLAIMDSPTSARVWTSIEGLLSSSWVGLGQPGYALSPRAVTNVTPPSIVAVPAPDPDMPTLPPTDDNDGNSSDGDEAAYEVEDCGGCY